MHALPKIKPRKGKLKNFASNPLYKFDPATNSWISWIAELTSHAVDHLSIATLNVLFDIYQPELIFSDERRLRLIEELRVLDADIVGLQEVTPKCLRELLTVPWIREHYYVSEVASEDDSESPTIYPYGQILLSKYPFKPIFHEFSEYSKAIAGEFCFNARSLVVPVVHLSSDKNKPLLFAAQRRAEQINVVLDYLKQRGDDCVLMMGDFNFKDEAEVLNVPHNFVDVWKQINPTDPGYTYDPVNNMMAAVTTTYGKKNRFDRLYLTAMSEWRPISCEFFAHQPFTAKNGRNTLNVSDHYGIKTVLACTSSSDERLAAPRPQLTLDGRALYLDTALESFVINQHIVAPEVTLRKMEKASGKVKSTLRSLLSKSQFKLRHIGSMQLGVVLENTVIDLLIIGFIPRAEMFEKLMKAYMIKKDPNEDYESMQYLDMERAGCPVHVIYCHIPVPYTFDTDFKAHNVPVRIVEAMDPQSRLNFKRLLDCDAITTHTQNLKAFNGAASFIKYWAKKHELYGEEQLSGMAINLMVAKLCAENEVATGDWILVRFFETYAQWDWLGQKTLIALTPVDHWQAEEEYQVAPVLTPSTPHINLTQRVSVKNMKRIVAELQRINTLIQDTLLNNKTMIWETLL